MRNKFILLIIFSVLMQIGYAAHPSLFFDSADIPSLQQKITTGRSLAAFNLMQTRANTYLTLATNPYNFNDAISGRAASVQLFDLALTGILTGNTQYTNKAVSIICAIAEQSDVNTFVGFNDHLAVGDMAHAYAVAYDWLAPYMTTEQKTLVEAEIYSFGQWLYEHSLTDYYGSTEPRRLAHNHQAVAHGGMGLCALVLGEAAPAIWKERATSKIRSYFDYAVDSTGCAYEGMTYLAYGMQGAVPFAAALKHIGGADIIAEKPITTLIPQYYMWQLLPWGSTGVMLNQSGDTMKPAGGVMYLIARNQDSVGLWGWDRMVGSTGDASYGQSTWLGAGASLPYVILWEDQQLQPQSPVDSQLLNKYFERGQVSLRDGWDDDSSFATFTSGFSWPGCWSHGDINSFTFYAKGEKFGTDPGAGLYETPYHSAITVSGQGQDWYQPGSAVTGQIISYQQQGAATYIKGDAKAAYVDMVDAKKAIRQLLYVRGSQPYLVITDDFEINENAVKSFQWRLTTDFTNNLVVDEFVRTSHILGAAAGAKCEIKCLWPQTFSLQSISAASSYKQLVISSTGYSGKFVVLMLTAGAGEVLPTVTKTGDSGNMEISLAFADGTTDTISLSLENIEFSRNVPCKSPVGDFDADCKVDFADFRILATQWLSCSDPAVFDCYDMR